MTSTYLRTTETCPISTEGWTRRVHFVRGRGAAPPSTAGQPDACSARGGVVGAVCGRWCAGGGRSCVCGVGGCGFCAEMVALRRPKASASANRAPARVVGSGWPRSGRRWPRVLRVGSGHREATVQGCGQRQAAECTARCIIGERRDESMSALGSRQNGSSETAAWAQGSLGAGWRHQVRFVRAERKDSSSLMCPSLSHPAPSSAAYCSSSSSLGDARYSLCPIA